MPQPVSFADFHIHPQLKAFNSGHPKPAKNIWEHIDHPKPTLLGGHFAMAASKNVAKYSQTNFYRLIQGNLRVIFLSYYPTEKGFLDIRPLSGMLAGKKGMDQLISVATGYDIDRIGYLKKQIGYFEMLQDEYNYIKDAQGKSPCGKYAYKIVKNFTELKHIAEKQPDTIAIVNTIEGAHVLFNHKMMTEKLGKQEMKDELTKNVIALKEWEHPPFIINIAHHFYNGLCGHSKSFKVIVGEALVNQKKGIGTGFTGLGMKAMKELLSNSNGKRIHIDTKHMSLEARKEYYEWLKSHNYIDKNDRIPIICSHSGLNGYKTMSGSGIQTDNTRKNAKSRFFNWSINNSDEEINLIHDSGGLLGLMLDRGKLGGGKFLKDLGKIKDASKRKEACLEIFWENVFQGIHAVGKKSAWDIFCIGSDLDGSIEHLEPYPDTTKFPDLWNDLHRWLDKTQYRKELWFGYKPEELTNKIMYQNLMDFSERYFV